jgi:hypothetical protein
MNSEVSPFHANQIRLRLFVCAYTPSAKYPDDQIRVLGRHQLVISETGLTTPRRVLLYPISVGR